VTIIIPTKDRLDLLEPCVSSLLRFDAGVDFEVLIVDNGSVEKSTQAYFDSLPENLFRVIRDDGDFNFSRLNNYASRQASKEILCLLNNDTEVTSDFWLSNLVGTLSDSVKVVGPLLLYPDGSVQHAGVVLGLGGIADHAFRGEESSSNRHMNYIHLPRACSAVTAACLVVRKDVYFEVGGLSEDFQVGFNDVDFCLRVGKLGGRVVYDPRVSLIHKESKSRGVDKGVRAIRAGIEVVKMIKIWGNALTEDPFYNPNLSLNAEQSFFANSKRN
jgi:GT2 family glycosyltransferase